MSQNNQVMFWCGRNRQSGQAIALVLVLLLGLLGAAAAVVDMGNLYFSYQALRSTTTAAALAGGAAISAGTAKDTANLYSGQSSADYNYRTNLNINNVNVNLACVNTSSYPNIKLAPCVQYTVAQGAVNAIQVTETAQVPTYFAKVFGVPYLTISTTASASAKGGGAPPYHIMMVLDSTASMGSGSDPGCLLSNPLLTLSPEQCAQEGVQTLLGYLSPCVTTQGQCVASGTTGVVKNPVDQVALMTFPGLCSATGSGVTTANCPVATTLTNTTANSTYAPNDYACPSKAPPIASYNNNPEYLILPFQSDYRASDSASALNGSSNLVQSVGATTDGKCTGITTPGGEGTFYAGVIDAAQAYLTSNNTQNVQNIMILLSDGNPTASSGQMGGKVTTYKSTAECSQAISSANAAKTAGTLIYSVSYGSEATGCSPGEGLTPCQTMEQISSSPTGGAYFFSVPQTVKGVTSTVCSGAVPITKLDQVFTTIGGDLTTTRLIPNSVF